MENFYTEYKQINEKETFFSLLVTQKEKKQTKKVRN